MERFRLAQSADQVLEILVAGPDLPLVDHAYALGENLHFKECVRSVVVEKGHLGLQREAICSTGRK